MQCDIILIYKKSTQDSEIELAENQISLFRKYNHRQLDNGRRTVCYALQMGSAEKPDVSEKMKEVRSTEHITVDNDLPDLKGKGSVGIYLLCHTADMRTTAADTAARIYKAVVEDKGGDVRKISVACCNAVDKRGGVKGIMREFCSGLEKQDRIPGRLRDGMMVAGFNTTITTFDIDPKFMKGEGNKDLYENAEQMRKKGRRIGTVTQDHSNKMITFTHEKVDGTVAANFLAESEAQIEALLKQRWQDDKNTILGKLKGQIGKDCAALSGMSLDEVLLGSTQKLADLVNAKSLDNFRRALRGVLGSHLFATALSAPSINRNETLALRQSLEAYIKMKKVLKYNATSRTFFETTLDEYTDNRGLGDVLAFVQKSGAQFAAEFFP